MKRLSIALLIFLFSLVVAQDALAQRDMFGKIEFQTARRSSVRLPSGVNAVTSTLVGPVYPPPLGTNFTMSGLPNDGMLGRPGGKDWWFSGVNLSSHTTVYWGPVNGDVRLSMDGGAFTSAETLQYSSGLSNLANGFVEWEGTSSYYQKITNAPIAVTTQFLMTVTDSATGTPIALTAAPGVGLPTNVGAVVTVTPGLHYRVNFRFLVNNTTPHLDFFDANANAVLGQAYSSFGAGFYYVNIPPTISSIANQTTIENNPVGPLPFVIHDLEQPPNALLVTAWSSNQIVVPNGNLALGGADTSRTITVTPGTNQTGTATITVTVFDGADSASTSFNLLVVPPIQFQVAPHSLNYGNVLVGSTRMDSVIASNPGAGTVHISSATSNNPKFVVTPTADSIPGTGNKKFFISYSPTATVADSGKIYFIHDAPTSPDSVLVSGNGVLKIILTKRQDADGDTLTAGDQTAKRWHLALYASSVSLANLVAEADTSDLTVSGLEAGVYIATEADSGVSWQRINGNQTLQDTVSLSVTPVTTISFVNFKPNSLAVSSFQDNDGNFATGGDRVAKQWHLEIHRNSAGGPLVLQGDATSIASANLGDGTYYATEADSLNWLHLGYVANGTPVASPGTNAVQFALAGGQQGTINFVNAPPVYSKYFRSFRQDSLGLDKDNAGKLGKPVKRKAKFVDFSFDLIAPQTVSLTLKFSMISTGVAVKATDTVGVWSNSKLVTTFPVSSGSTVHVTGRGFKGALMKATYEWATLPHPTKGTVTLASNILRLPMPDRVNALFEAYNASGFVSTGGLLVGRVQPKDSAKSYGWVLHKKYADVLKSLYDKKAITPLHDGPAHGFDFVKAQSKLPKTKSNNVLFADLVTLKLNVVASMLGITTVGLGELVYDDGTSNPMNGRMVKELIGFADSALMGYWQSSVHLYPTAQTFKSLDSAIANVNSAFEGPMDTISFATSLVLKGTRQLGSAPYLRANPGIVPATLDRVNAGLTESPLGYQLYQNFPNPFNPSTTIQFDLPQPSMVTLKVYNMLGQEIATLAENQQMEDGYQEVTFEARSIASGVYFYRLSATGIPSDDNNQQSALYTITRKMLLIK